MNKETIRGVPAAVIFDMDGVLIDSEPVHFEATRELLAEQGVVYRHEPELEARFVGCTDREVFRVLKARFNLVGLEADLAAAWIARVVQRLSGPLTPLPGVPEVLVRLRREGVRLALASSSAPEIIAATLAGLGLSGTFEFTVSGHDVARSKPAPDIFLEAVRRLGVAAAECVVVEDSFNGVRAAVSAGLRCVAVPCRATCNQDFRMAAVRLVTLEELPSWLGL